MTVQEFIKALSKYPLDTEVYIRGDYWPSSDFEIVYKRDEGDIDFNVVGRHLLIDQRS